MTYLRLIWMYYDTENPLPKDPDKLAFMLGACPKDTRLILSHFFYEDADFYRHKRCDCEISAYRARQEHGKKAAQARWKNAQSMPSASGEHAQSTKNHANREPITDNRKKEEGNSDFPDAGASPRRPAIPYEEIVNLYHQLLPKNPRIHSLTTKRKAQIRARWLDGSLPDLDTWAQYFKFVSESNFLTGMVMPRDGRKPFVANLEWLTNETNFTNVAEKKYHG